jgi:hypothetical protein
MHALLLSLGTDLLQAAAVGFRRKVLGALEERCLALTDADAHRREAIAAAAAAKLVQEGHDETRAAHPERVAESDCATVDVHPLGIEAQLADDDQTL